MFLHDPWFYATLLLAIGYIIQGAIAYKVTGPLRNARKAQKRYARTSTLKQKLG